MTIQDNTLSGFLQDAVNVSAAGVIQGNSVSQSGTGILANGGSGLQVFGNQVANSQVGLAGSAILGGSDWSIQPAPPASVWYADGTPDYNEIDNNQVGIEASSGDTIAFNRVIGGAVGILVDGCSNVTISHDVVARTTEDAIHVQDSSNVTIQSDTLYVPPPAGGPAADGVLIDNASSSVALQNNIIWSESGYDIYVAADSQQGFASDYNDLFASGTGMVAGGKPLSAISTTGKPRRSSTPIRSDTPPMTCGGRRSTTRYSPIAEQRLSTHHDGPHAFHARRQSVHRCRQPGQRLQPAES